MTVAEPRFLTDQAVGRSVPRPDGVPKIRGRAMYVSDMTMPNMLVGAILRSPHPHARILSIDISEATALPGVAAVVTQADLADVDAYYGHYYRDRPVLADGVARFAGEPVAAVAAVDAETAEEATTRIVIEYEQLPSAGDVEAARAEGAPLVHTGIRRRPNGTLDEHTGDNICFRYEYCSGDAAALFASAPIVVSGSYRFPAVYQYAMEPHVSIADWRGDELTVWSSCQHPFLVQAELAAIFGLPVARVRMVVPFVGGGYGSKSYTRLEPLTVALSRAAGRPVKLGNDVEGAMLTTRRHNMICRMRTAADRDGRLLAREVRIAMDTGAYADNGPTVTQSAGVAGSGPYRWSALDVEALCTYTHRPPAGSYRGFGNAHLTWIGESQVDEVARRAGLDPLTVRQHNLVRRGERLYPEMTPIDADLIGDLEDIARELRLDEPTPANQGKAIAIGLGRGGAETISGAVVSVDAQGGVRVLVGSTEIGQGVRTVHAQVAAEVLGVPVEQVSVVMTDTAYTPFDRSTGASRSTTIAGLAVQRAAQDALDQLRSAAARMLEAHPGDVEARGGGLWVRERRVSHAAAVQVHTGARGVGGGEVIGRGNVTAADFSTVPAFWEVGAAGVHLAVDPDTGQVRLRRVVTVADVGRAINPALVERQDEGCAAQAIGNSLFEEMDFSPEGVLLNPSLLDYRVPTTEDMPESAHCIIVENGDGPGPFGAKGCGEGVFGGLPAAIVNALAQAGARITELPATPERVWRAMHAEPDEAPPC